MSSEARHQRDGADEDARSARSSSTRPSPVECWGNLGRDQHLAAVAAALLFATMLLPWYQQNAVVSTAKSQPLVSRNLNAFAVFSFVEAAVLLVAIAVLVLLYARAVGRAFQLPGGDGVVIFAAGIWTALLLVLRLFDKPGITHNGVAANVGIQWGIFFALAAAGLLAYSGSRMRAARRPEPPLLRHEPRARPRGASGDDRPRRAQPSEERTEIVARRERIPAALPVSAQAQTPEPSAPSPADERPRHPPAPPKSRARPSAPETMDQLSFEDTEPGA